MVKVNPLNVLDCREVRDPPPYFHYHYLDLKFNIIHSLKEWIYTNLKYRFYISESLALVDNQYTVKLKIGFEEPKELSFFLLACSHLKYLNN